MASSALLLIDCQDDFLARSGLVPDRVTLTERAAHVLARWRALGLPVAHVHTVTEADGDDRMPHWQRAGLRACVAGSAGAAPPPALAPRAGELVARKRFYSGFADPALDAWLREHGISRLVLAGVYLHACVRGTALDAYERGYEVVILDDVVGTAEPLHGEATRAWLGTRAASFRSAGEVLVEHGDAAALSGDARASLPVAVIGGVPRPAGGAPIHRHRDPCATERVLASVPCGGADDIAEAARVATDASRAWTADAVERAAFLDRWADDLEREKPRLVELVVREVGKPRRFADEEAGRAVAHARVAAELARGAGAMALAPGVTVVSRPLGVVGLLTPWNNPLAMPVGKIAPALAFGNGVVLKPAPQASETALALVESLARAGAPVGLVAVVLGTNEAARALCREPRVAAIALTGALETGRVVAALCAEGLKPLQAELGGNNAAIVLADADLERLVPDLVASAFGFAGQRCTAIRRFVVEERVAARFEEIATKAIATLVVGDPGSATTDVGPLVAADKRDRVLALLAAARRAGARIVTGGVIPAGWEHGAWLAPTLVADVAPESSLVQEETFAPVAVLQVARDVDHAVALANGVPQGLVQAVHTADPAVRARVLAAAEAGILQAGLGPLAIHPRAPFVGWKASGLGPPEHGAWDAWFYARVQARYGDGAW